MGLDPLKDFTVLCSNCHRMIHKTEFVDRVEEFKAKYLISE
jgi:5-methylcytosine-specific restriction protein A